MKTWVARTIRDSLRYPTRLLEKRIVAMSDKEHYMNAYEYALFTDTDLCHRLSNCMHAQGLVVRDTVTPYVMHLAMISNNVHNYAALAKIKWNERTFQGVLKRPDALKLLMRKDYGLNGFEFGLTILPKLVGTLISKHDLRISNVIRFKHFKKCKGIKRLFV